MRTFARHTAILMLLCALGPVFSLSAQIRGGDTEKTETGGNAGAVSPFIDRWAFKTNAFEWLLTIPNFGFELDMTGSEYNSWTFGVTAKCNWDSYHNLKPATVFNLFDVRPEFRHYFRSTPKPERNPAVKRTFGKWFRDEFWTTDRKNPRSWRAQYVGVYVDYASYSFKIGPKGIGGRTLGFGASTGYALPMYQYKRGNIDVELGFSVGLQFCTRDVYTYNVDGNYYTSLPAEEGTKGFHFTPFPVISELRASFVWRHKSIKDKVKINEEKIKNRKKLEYNTALVLEDLDRNLPVSYKVRFDNDFGSDELRRLKQNDSLYRARFDAKVKEQVDYMKDVAIKDPMMGFNNATRKKLERKVDERRKEVIAEFGRLWTDEKKMRAEKEKEARRKEMERQKQLERERLQAEKERKEQEKKQNAGQKKNRKKEQEE